MYRRLAGIFLPVAAIALVITGIWGNNQSKKAQAFDVKSENQYQRAFHSLSNHVDQLQDELGKAQVSNSPDQLRNTFNTIWRISYIGQNEVGQLPFSLMPFHHTQAFLNDLGTFAYSISTDKTLSAKGLSTSQRNELKQLYTESKDVKSNLQKVQASVLNDGARWTDAENALSDQSKGDNVIVDGFQTLEKQVSQFPEIKWGPTTNPSQVRTVKPDVSKLSGDNLSSNQAKQKAAEFLGRNDLQNFSIEKNGPGMEYPSYSVTANKSDGAEHIEMTQKGGHVTWYLKDRAAGASTLDLSQGRKIAEDWLAKHHYSNMQMVSTEQYDGVGVYQFVYSQNGVSVYTDKVTVKVALDNGQVMGLQAKDYVFHQPNPMKLTPKLTLDQAKQRVNPNLKIEDGNLTVIHNEQGAEVLAYQFMGTLDSDTYKVYINANTGGEEGVEKLSR